MKIRRQTKTYTCSACGDTYLHDDAHHHGVFLCPTRPKTKQQLLQIGKTYEPKARG